MRRRTFLKSSLISAAALATDARADSVPARRAPNILWISAEDISPDLGCYGDAYASTPHIDTFAKTAIRFDRAYSHSGVCAPTRSGIITGMYPTSIGTHHMRCDGVPPAEVKCFPEYLRAAGYYCTNNAKTDYQFAPPLSAWDRNGKNAHWREREDDQPFFAVFNIGVCHESQVRSREPELLKQIEDLGPRRHDPALAPVPPYHADTPATRRDWAQYYDVISLMDLEVGKILAELEADGLAEDTIVWFWGDHGRGLTRGKRWLYESGTRVPLLIHVPERHREWVRPAAPETLAPGATDELVAFVDFAPTMLSLAGAAIPEHLQGRAFLGRDQAPLREYVYGARDRMDEAYDIIRTVRDKKFRYFRNYMPYVTYAQHIQYMDQMPMLQDLRRLHAEGKLSAGQEKWFAPEKSLEELYDVEADPHELTNLAEDPRYRADLLRLRNAHHAWMAETGDLGLIPEPLLDELKWPGGAIPACAPVVFSRLEDKILMRCETPGASINYRWGDAPNREWRLYAEPIEPREGRELLAKASRAGFKDGPDLRWGVYEKTPVEETKIVSVRLAELRGPGQLLDRLSQLRMKDGAAREHIEDYVEAAQSDEAALRYWGIVALHRLTEPEAALPAYYDLVRSKLDDPSAVVRVAAAHAATAWGNGAQAIPVLIDVLIGGTQSERLFAAVALSQLEEAARPAEQALQAAEQDSWPYVGWVAREAVETLVNNT